MVLLGDTDRSERGAGSQAWTAPASGLEADERTHVPVKRNSRLKSLCNSELRLEQHRTSPKGSSRCE